MSEVLGIDIGGGSIKTVLLRNGEAVASGASDHYERPDREMVLVAMRQAIGQLPIGAGGTLCAGLCTPGILNKAGTRVEQAVNLPGLVDLDLEGVVSDCVGGVARVRVYSDALASVYGYWAQRPVAGRLLGLVIGTGVGACVLDDGEPLVLADNCPGHIGQIDVGGVGDEPSPIGPDGGAGSLEAYIGTRSLRARFDGETVSALLRAPADDVAFCALARAIRVCHAIYRPDSIVLLGGMGTRLGPRLGDIERLVRTDLTSVAKSNWALCCGESDQTGAFGAACLAERAMAGVS